MKFPSYPISSLKGDLSGGLVAGVIALPLALAFGVQSGLGAAAGLYGAIALGVLAAALGGTRTQASGPTGPMTVVSASIVAVAIEQTGSLQSAMGVILLAFLAGGVFQIILGLLGVGRYVKYFPYPVISGFMTGVGFIIIALQIWPFLGSPSPKSTLAVFTGIGQPLANVNVSAVLLGLLTVAIYYLFPKVTKKIPSVLVALLVGTGVAAVANLTVPTIGDIPTGIPALQIGELLRVAPEHYTLIIGFGLTLALLGSIDSLADLCDCRQHHQDPARQPPRTDRPGHRQCGGGAVRRLARSGGDQGNRRQYQCGRHDTLVRRGAWTVSAGCAAGASVNSHQPSRSVSSLVC